ncbi:MAG: glycosyltransferase family 2 protein [Deltaproteobacteria bacterium]|nr:MAG: glycosyltransferase family 2 protein [Deltaproteobacteria bacterium]
MPGPPAPGGQRSALVAAGADGGGTPVNGSGRDGGLDAVRLVVVTPARNESEHLPHTIASMRAQRLVPLRWVIVDDGSTDGTGERARELGGDIPWMEVVTRHDRGERRPGGGVVEAFYAGYERVAHLDWTHLVKLDADLEFGPDYFAVIVGRMLADRDLGIAGGMIENLVDGRRVLEQHPRFHVRGATKVYTRACWEAIGGLHAVKGWDTLDELQAARRGFRTVSFDDVRLVQRRFTGDGTGQWINWNKNGEAAYVCGYHPAYLVAKAVRRAFVRPWLVASVGLLVGYARAALRRRPRVDDAELRAFVREQQWRRLTGRSSLWR